MEKRKTKKLPIIIILLLIVIAIGGFALFRYIQYRNSNTYKLLELGYTDVEVKQIESKLKNVDKVVNMKHDSKIIKFINEKYFIESNLDDYLSYQSKNIKKDSNEVVALVNVGANSPHYENTNKADLNKKELILVNKYNYLEENDIVSLNSTPSKIVPISTKYAYADNFISSDIYDAYKDLCEGAIDSGFKLVATSGYRNYADQKKLYDSYVSSKGEKYADDYAARPGYSEHQTGLTIDLLQTGTDRNTFKDSDAYKWLLEHAHEYGFILRYPEGKEEITGYEFEPWHYRYVGKEYAAKIKKEGITFEEYYAYYLK